MNKKPKRDFSADFKSNVVIEVLLGQSTLTEIAAKYHLDPDQITNWKKELLEDPTKAFQIGRKRNSPILQKTKKKIRYYIKLLVNSK